MGMPPMGPPPSALPPQSMGAPTPDAALPADTVAPAPAQPSPVAMGIIQNVSNIVTSALTVTSGIASADIKKVNAVTVTGNGSPGTEWGP